MNRHHYNVKLRVSVPSEDDLDEAEVGALISSALDFREHTDDMLVEGSITVRVHGTDIPDKADRIRAHLEEA